MSALEVLIAARQAIHNLCLERESTEGYRETFDGLNALIAELTPNTDQTETTPANHRLRLTESGWAVEVLNLGSWVTLAGAGFDAHPFDGDTPSLGERIEFYRTGIGTWASPWRKDRDVHEVGSPSYEHWGEQISTGGELWSETRMATLDPPKEGGLAR